MSNSQSPQQQTPRPIVTIFTGRRRNNVGIREVVQGRTAFECSLCQGQFMTQSELLSHLAMHASSAGGQCPQCSKTLQEADLKMHLFGHSRTIIVRKETRKEPAMEASVAATSSVSNVDGSQINSSSENMSVSGMQSSADLTSDEDSHLPQKPLPDIIKPVEVSLPPDVPHVQYTHETNTSISETLIYDSQISNNLISTHTESTVPCRNETDHSQCNAENTKNGSPTTVMKQSSLKASLNDEADSNMISFSPSKMQQSEDGLYKVSGCTDVSYLQDDNTLDFRNISQLSTNPVKEIQNKNAVIMGSDTILVHKCKVPEKIPLVKISLNQVDKKSDDDTGTPVAGDVLDGNQKVLAHNEAFESEVPQTVATRSSAHKERCPDVRADCQQLSPESSKPLYSESQVTEPKTADTLYHESTENQPGLNIEISHAPIYGTRMAARKHQTGLQPVKDVCTKSPAKSSVIGLQEENALVETDRMHFNNIELLDKSQSKKIVIKDSSEMTLKEEAPLTDASVSTHLSPENIPAASIQLPKDRCQADFSTGEHKLSKQIGPEALETFAKESHESAERTSPLANLYEERDVIQQNSMLKAEQKDRKTSTPTVLKTRATRNTITKMSSPVNVRKEFVPNYEPIQTRKRAKSQHFNAPTNIHHTPSMPKRHRGGKTPETSPMPKAVPKSLLILDPFNLPRSARNKMVQKNKSPSVSFASPHDRDNSLESSQVYVTVTLPSGEVVQLSEAIFDSSTSSLIQASNLLSTSAVAPASEPYSVKQPLTSFAQDALGDQVHSNSSTKQRFIQYEDSQGKAAFVKEHLQAFAALDNSSSQNENQADIAKMDSTSVSDDTPTSLLLLAEAAYPTGDTSSAAATPSVDHSISPESSVLPVVDNQKDSLPGKFAVLAKQPGGVACKSAAAAKKIKIAEESSKREDDSSHWACTVCGELVKQENRSQHVTQHVDEEEEEEEVVCDVCGEQMPDEEGLELHMAVEHDEEEVVDHDAIAGEDVDDSSSEHVTFVHKTLEDEMDDAVDDVNDATSAVHQLTQTRVEGSSIFPVTVQLHKNFRDVHTSQKVVFKCTQCPLTFSSLLALESHGQQNHKVHGNQFSFKCSHCHANFSTAKALNSHVHSCHSEVPRSVPARRGRGRGRERGSSVVKEHACGTCGKVFSSDVYLRAHLKSHGGRWFQCLYCSDKFFRIGALKEHFAAKHPQALPFKCSICQRGFTRNANCLIHERTHTTVKLHRCQECGESFTLQTYLQRHLRYRHLRQMTCTCEVCGKEFLRRADMVKHLRTHTGERPYKCEICGFGFAQQSNYKYHMMRHRGEQPHKCPVCDRGFRLPSHLKTHLLQHGDSRYPCTVCDKVFSLNRYLQRHMRIHTGLKDSLPAPPASIISSSVGTMTAYDADSSISTLSMKQKMKPESIIIEPIIETYDSQHIVAQTTIVHDPQSNEPVIHFIINDDKGSEHGDSNSNMAIVDGQLTTIVTTMSSDSEAIGSETRDSLAKMEDGEEGGTPGDVVETQTYVNADEGTNVVVGQYEEGEGGGMDEGTVTIPFRDLAHLLGGKHYKCDVCSENFNISPNSTYNMIHTGQSHILVISLNDH